MVNSYKKIIQKRCERFESKGVREGQMRATTTSRIQSVLIQWKDGSYEADSSHY